MGCTSFCFKIPAFDPRLYFLQRPDGRSVGAIAIYFDDSLRRERPRASFLLQDFLENRLRELRSQESPATHAGDSDCSLAAAEQVLTVGLDSPPTSPTLWSARQRVLPLEATRNCQCKIWGGALCG